MLRARILAKIIEYQPIHQTKLINLLTPEGYSYKDITNELATLIDDNIIDVKKKLLIINKTKSSAPCNIL